MKKPFLDPFYVRIGSAILFIVLARYLWLTAGKNKKYNIPQPKVDPNYLDPSEDYEKIAYEFHDAIDGLDFAQKKSAIMKKLLSLNDQEFTNVYNIYNSTYAKKGQTMRKDLADEWWLGTDGVLLEERFKRLNLV